MSHVHVVNLVCIDNAHHTCTCILCGYVIMQSKIQNHVQRNMINHFSVKKVISILQPLNIGQK